MAETEWRQMRSGDWKLAVHGQRWAVAFVWRTLDRGYAWATNGHRTNYHPKLTAARLLASEQWNGSENMSDAEEVERAAEAAWARYDDSPASGYGEHGAFIPAFTAGVAWYREQSAAKPAESGEVAELRDESIWLDGWAASFDDGAKKMERLGLMSDPVRVLTEALRREQAKMNEALTSMASETMRLRDLTVTQTSTGELAAQLMAEKATTEDLRAEVARLQSANDSLSTELSMAKMQDPNWNPYDA